MNTDVGDLVRSLRAEDLRRAVPVVAALAAVILFVLTARWLAMGVIQNNQAREEYEAVSAQLEQLERMRAESPVTMTRRIEETRDALHEQLAGWPTSKQLSEQLARFYQYAQAEGAQVVRLEALMTSPEDEAEPAYRPHSYFVGASGEPEALLRFMRRVAGLPFTTLLLDNTTLMTEDTSVTIYVDLIIYVSDVLSDLRDEPLPPAVEPEGQPVTPVPEAGQRSRPARALMPVWKGDAA